MKNILNSLSRYRNPILAALLFSLIVGTTRYGANISAPDPVVTETTSKATAEQTPIKPKRDLTRELSEIEQRYKDRIELALSKFETQLEDIAKRARPQTTQHGIDDTESLRGFNNVVKCVYYGAKDKIKGSKDLQNYVNESLAPSTRFIREIQAEYQSSLMQLSYRLQEIVNDYRAEILDFRSDLDLEDRALIDFDTALNVIGNFATDFAKSQRSAVTASITGVVDAALIGTTYRSITTLLAPMITRIASSTSFAALLTIIDGPLPVGDIVAAVIAVGGTVWTISDMHKAVKENEALAGKLEQALKQEITSLESTAFDQLDRMEEQTLTALRAPTAAIEQPTL